MIVLLIWPEASPHGRKFLIRAHASKKGPLHAKEEPSFVVYHVLADARTQHAAAALVCDEILKPNEKIK